MVAYSSECDIIKATDWCLSGREDDMREKKVWSFRAAILVAAVIVAIIMVNQYMRSIEAELKNEMQVTLHDVAEQTSTILRREIESEQDLLVGLAKELAQMDPENEEIIMETLKPNRLHDGRICSGHWFPRILSEGDGRKAGGKRCNHRYHW